MEYSRENYLNLVLIKTPRTMSVSRKKFLLGALTIVVLFLFVLEFVPQSVVAATRRTGTSADMWTETFSFFSGGATFIAKVIENQYTRALAFIIIITVFFTQLIRFLLTFSVGSNLSEEQKKMIKGMTITISILLSLGFLSTAGFGSYRSGDPTPKLENIPASADKIIVQFGTGFWQFGIPLLVALVFMGFPKQGDTKRSWVHRIGNALLAFGLVTLFIQARTRIGVTSTAMTSIILGTLFILFSRARDTSNSSVSGSRFGSSFGKGIGGFVKGFKDGFTTKSEPLKQITHVKKKAEQENKDDATEEKNILNAKLVIDKEKENLNSEIRGFRKLSEVFNQVLQFVRSIQTNDPLEDAIVVLKQLHEKIDALIKINAEDASFDKRDSRLDKRINRLLFYKIKKELKQDDSKSQAMIDELQKSKQQVGKEEVAKIDKLIQDISSELQLIKSEEGAVSGSGIGGVSGGLGAFIEADQLTRAKLIGLDNEKKGILSGLQKSILELESEAETAMKLLRQSEQNNTPDNRPIAEFSQRFATWKTATLNELQRFVILLNRISESYTALDKNYDLMHQFILQIINSSQMRKSQTNEILHEISTVFEDETKENEDAVQFKSEITNKMNSISRIMKQIEGLFKQLVRVFLENSNEFETIASSFFSSEKQLLEEITQMGHILENKKRDETEAFLLTFLDDREKELATIRAQINRQWDDVTLAKKVRFEIFSPMKTLEKINTLEERKDNDKKQLALWANDQQVMRKILEFDLNKAIVTLKTGSESEFYTLLQEKTKHLMNEFELHSPQQNPNPTPDMASSSSQQQSKGPVRVP